MVSLRFGIEAKFNASRSKLSGFNPGTTASSFRAEIAADGVVASSCPLELGDLAGQ
jgi:hypothetical protein